MKRILIALCVAFAFGFVGYASAQSTYGGGQSTPPDQSTHSSKHSKQSREVTLTGCLEQGSSSNVYVLRNATEENQAGGSSMGTSGSSTQSQSQSSTSSQSEMGQQTPMDFQLSGKDLSKYVGQRVEVRGKVEPMKENRSGMSSQGTSGQTGTTSGTQGTTGTQSGSAGGGSMSGGSSSGQSTTAGPITHRVKVSSIRQLGSSCQ